MAFTINGNVGGSSQLSGRSTQGHILYAVNQGAYWALFLSSTQSLSALWSANSGGSWSTPTGSPFSLTKAHNNESRNFGFAYGNISGTDALHMVADYLISNQAYVYHSRFTLGTTWTNTNAEAAVGTSTSNNLPVVRVSGGTTGLSSSNKPFDFSSYFDDGTGGPISGFDADIASNADSGASWTAGYGTPVVLGSSVDMVQSSAAFSLGSGKMLAIGDDGASSSTFAQLQYATWNGTTWSASANVLATSVTGTDTANWGACARTTSDIHVLALSNNSNTFVHRRYNGSSWSNGDTIGNLTLASLSGVSLVTDGTLVVAAAIDNSGNLKTNKWSSGSGWAGWTTQEASLSNTPTYVTGVYNPTGSEIMWMWTARPATNYGLFGSLQTLAAPDGPDIIAVRDCIAVP